MRSIIKAEEKDKGLGLIIVDEAPDYLVVDKPAGLLAHPAPGKEEKTLAGELTARYPEIAAMGDNRERPGMVHRLDRDASGLMVIARTQPMFAHLKEQFKNRTINKEYLALAHGAIKHDHNVINRPIGRSLTKGGRMAAHSQNQAKDREAKTEYWVEKRFAHYTLLRVKPRTGRPHQIRVHLNSFGYPIVGDRLYTNEKARRSLVRHPLPRLFLHAAKLGFRDLQDEYKEYKSSLPNVLQEFLTMIK